MSHLNFSVDFWSVEERYELQHTIYEITERFVNLQDTSENRALMEEQISEAAKCWLLSHPPRALVRIGGSNDRI